MKIANIAIGATALAAWAGLALAEAPAPAPIAATPAPDVVARLEAIASRSQHTPIATPRFAFTGNLSLAQPASGDEATMGFPDTAIADQKNTFSALVDPDTAWVTSQLGEYSTCGKAGCAKQAPESVLRATAVFEKTDGTWQPIAWAITPSIPSTSQQDAADAKIVPDQLASDTSGADDVVKLFQSSIGDPKAFAATIADRKDVVMFGSELPERYVGAKAKAQIKAWNFGFAVRDGVRAGLSKSGNIAWVAANVDAKSVKRPKSAPIPFRMFAIYEKTATGWQVVQLQFSTAV